MRTRKLTLERGAAALALATLALIGNNAFAAEYWLIAAVTSVPMPNPDKSVGAPPSVDVPMWGYAMCTDGSYGSCGLTTVPGPALTVPAGDTTLTVHLRNDLGVPTSLVINGLFKPMAPVLFEPADPNTTYSARPAGNKTARVRSFDAETAPGGVGRLHLAERPARHLSVPKRHAPAGAGADGPVWRADEERHRSRPGIDAWPAYPGAGSANEYDNQATLLYSEIDPALHAAVKDGSYGTTGPTSTFGYAPKYFLVNGQPYPFGAQPLVPVGDPGTTLLRLLNAGLMTHVPMIQGTHWTLVAEDGKPYPYARIQYTALLPAAKTVDVLLTPDDIGGVRYAVMDRRLSLSNAGVSDGGMMAILQYDAQGGGASEGNTAPIAMADAYSSVVGVTLNVGAAAGVLGNDSDPDNLPLPIKAVAASGNTAKTGGSYTLNSNGSFSYTPPAGVNTDPDSFTYRVTDGKTLSEQGTVTINLTVPVEPTTFGVGDTFNGIDAPSLGDNWSQTASTGGFPDLQIVSQRASAVSTDLGGLAIWNQHGVRRGPGRMASHGCAAPGCGGECGPRPEGYRRHDRGASKLCAGALRARWRATQGRGGNDGRRRQLHDRCQASGICCIWLYRQRRLERRGRCQGRGDHLPELGLCRRRTASRCGRMEGHGPNGHTNSGRRRHGR